MSSNRKVRGYIFQSRRTGRYFLAPGKGEVTLKQRAHVYSCEEIKIEWSTCHSGWGGKKEGKWLIVYE